MPEQITVAQAAERLGVSRARIHQRISDGSIPAHRLGGAWVIDAVDLRPARVSRPMSAAMTWQLGIGYDGGAMEAWPSELLRLQEKIRLLRRASDDIRFELVSSWLAARAGRVHLMVGLERADALSDDWRVVLSGVSDPRLGPGTAHPAGPPRTTARAAAVVVEGYVDTALLPPLVTDHRLAPAPEPRGANVVLHVRPLPGRPDPILGRREWALAPAVPRLFTAADLFDHGGADECRAGLELIQAPHPGSAALADCRRL